MTKKFAQPEDDEFLTIEGLLDTDSDYEYDDESFQKPLGKTLAGDTEEELYPHFDPDDTMPDPFIIHKCETWEEEHDEDGFCISDGKKTLVHTEYYLFGTPNPTGSPNARKFETYDEALQTAIENICTDSKDCKE